MCNAEKYSVVARRPQTDAAVQIPVSIATELPRRCAARNDGGGVCNAEKYPVVARRLQADAAIQIPLSIAAGLLHTYGVRNDGVRGICNDGEGCHRSNKTVR